MKTNKRFLSSFSINKMMIISVLAGLSIISCDSDDDGVTPVASFEVTLDGSFASFTSTAQNAEDTLWSFGDGSDSTEPNPTHRYNVSEEYEVFLLVSNGANTDVVSQIITIEVPSEPSPSFTFEVVDRQVTFTNMSSSGMNFVWNFGDDLDTSTEENPVYTYAEDGTYEVTLTASNAEGVEASFTESVSVLEVMPVAGFTFATTGLVADFTNTSVDAETYSWDFGDGVGVLEEENPSYTYTMAGTYTVVLTAISANGNMNTFETDLEIVSAVTPVAFYHVDYNGTELTFTTDAFETGDTDFPYISGTRDAVSFAWDFGDGTTSVEANPVHDFGGVSGTYTVSLTATSSTGDTDVYSRDVDASILVSGSLDNYVFENGYEGFVVDEAGVPITADGANYFRDENNNDWESPSELQTWLRTNVNDATVTVGMTTSEHEGTFALKYSEGSGNAQRRAYQEFPVISGQTYTVSFYVAVTSENTAIDFMTAYIFDGEIVDEMPATLATANESLGVQGTLAIGSTSRTYVQRSITFTAAADTAVFYMTVTGGAETFLDTVTIQ